MVEVEKEKALQDSKEKEKKIKDLEGEVKKLKLSLIIEKKRKRQDPGKNIKGKQIENKGHFINSMNSVVCIYH